MTSRFSRCLPSVLLVLPALVVVLVLVSAANPPSVLFEPVPPEKSGITWKHENVLSRNRYLPESMSPGAAIFDYDNDGWMDIYLVNSGPCDFFQPKQPLRNALYHNNHDGTFTDVTEKAGVPGRDFGIGAAAGDYDGDGWTDLLVTNYGRNVLYHNNHDGTFTDVTKKAGLDAPGLYTSAVWFDYDNDGRLDLFVGHFVKYSKALEHDCTQGGVPHYCYPMVYDPWPSKLFHNNGDGTFTDVSEKSGIGKLPGKAFGAVATDINNDGWMDLWVSNDSVQDFLWLNKGNGTFEEIALMADVGYNADGAARSGMGVDAGDFNNDGWEDLFVANINREKFSLYRNKHDNSFADDAGSTGIGMATHIYSGWGSKLVDYDNDGSLDLIVCNGHPDDMIDGMNSTAHYREPILLFHNDGAKFNLVEPATAGEPFRHAHPARGLAAGDLDNDGYPDFVVLSGGEVPLLIHNLRTSGNRWVGLKLTGAQAIGARVTWSAGGVRRTRLNDSGGSFLSSHDPRMVLGLAGAQQADWVEVRWPKPLNQTDRFENVASNHYYTLRPGGRLE